MLSNISNKGKVLGKSESIIFESIVSIHFYIYIYIFNIVSHIVKTTKVGFLKIKKKLKH